MIHDMRFYDTMQTATLAQPTFAETNYSPVLILPTSEGAAQVSHTVQTSDLFVPSTGTVEHTPVLYVIGQNKDAASRTVNVRWLLNGNSIATNSRLVVTNNYYTATCFNDTARGVVVGDVITAALWAPSSTAVEIQYSALAVLPTRWKIYRQGNYRWLLAGIEYVNAGLFTYPTLSVPNPLPTNGYYEFYEVGVDNLDGISLFAGYTEAVGLQSATYGAIRSALGDNVSGVRIESQPSYRYHSATRVPTQIKLRFTNQIASFT